MLIRQMPINKATPECYPMWLYNIRVLSKKTIQFDAIDLFKKKTIQ